MSKDSEEKKTNIDIRSTTVEKGIDLAKDFLGKLIMPTVEEVGLLFQNSVKLWRFKNQVRVLNRAKEFCERNNIQPKHIPVKLLSPLLEYSSLEEDEELQDKWAILLSNLVDSEQNIENHVFPSILSQLSKTEFLVLERVYFTWNERKENGQNALNVFLTENFEIMESKKGEINSIRELIIKANENKENIDEVLMLEKQRRNIHNQLYDLVNKEHNLRKFISQVEAIPSNLLKDFEVSNLIRVGVAKEEIEVYAESPVVDIYGANTVNFDIEVGSNTTLVMTNLGELFIKACREKKK